MKALLKKRKKFKKHKPVITEFDILEDPMSVLCSCVLCGDLQLSQIPFSLRTHGRAFYINAFRRCRACKDREGFQRVLDLLYEDIQNVRDRDIKMILADQYNSECARMWWVGLNQEQIQKEKHLHMGFLPEKISLKEL